MLFHHRLVKLLMFYLEHNQLKNSLTCYETGSHVTGTDLENSLAEGLEAISFVLELWGGGGEHMWLTNSSSLGVWEEEE